MDIIPLQALNSNRLLKFANFRLLPFCRLLPLSVTLADNKNSSQKITVNMFPTNWAGDFDEFVKLWSSLTVILMFLPMWTCIHKPTNWDNIMYMTNIFIKFKKQIITVLSLSRSMSTGGKLSLNLISSAEDAAIWATTATITTIIIMINWSFEASNRITNTNKNITWLFIKFIA